MVRKFKFVALTAGALMMAATPALAQDVVQDMMKTLGELDPTKALAPAPEPAPAAKPMGMKHHKMMHKKMGGKKMMMKKKMMKKKM